MSSDYSVNSIQYWNTKFETKWELNRGPEQTTFFYEVLLKNLPVKIKNRIKYEKMSICDIGCALGDGVNKISEYFTSNLLTGIDFSEEAIKKAKKKYPHIDFECQDILRVKQNFDVIISSNTLEHFKNPLHITRYLTEITNNFLIILIPFQENEVNRDKEHESSFNYNSFPMVIDDFFLCYHKVINFKDTPNPYWNGKQLLVIYSKKDELEKLNLSSVIEPKVFVGAPVRNRAWILPRFFESLLQQNVKMETCFIVNDCDDNTIEVLEENRVNFIQKNFGKEFGSNRGEYSKKNLAILRNLLLEEFLKSDCEYFFSIDTDIIIPDGSLRKLLEDDKDIVSMIISNIPSGSAHNIYINQNHVSPVPEGIIPVDMTGAVYLIKREVIESGVGYAYDPKGEDVPFCRSAINAGFELYCDTRLRPIHVYEPNLELTANIISHEDYKIILEKAIRLLEKIFESVISLKSNINNKLIILDIINAYNKVANIINIYYPIISNKLIFSQMSIIKEYLDKILYYIEINHIDEANNILNNLLLPTFSNLTIELIEVFLPDVMKYNPNSL
ncbi:methyltransferase domain-containing protein [Ureibacillus acetophenoni]|uniref:Methyltransferase family protein n=1 Tax=Ureibacillus acetophenoni TaxID=614649 RepID=A0A285U3Y5_9BACL|nr:methyltransferase domain-containing protein [Ureibacillus acetophenoni]SOC34971.1 methyltransferase family protein [Ureibacillus acetophenoni]